VLSMMNTRMILSYLGPAMAALVLTACAQSVGHFTPTPAANPENSVLYVYRPEATKPGLMKPLLLEYPDVLVDGKSIGVLKYDQYITSELAPGAHTVTITGLTATSSGWAARDIEKTIRASQGQPVFMKLQVEYDTDKMTLDQLGPKYIINLSTVSGDDARYEIRNTSPAK